VGAGRPAHDPGSAEYAATEYRAQERADYKIRAFRDDVLARAADRLPLVDVRSPGEYTGKLYHMEGYPQEGALRAGHIRGAVNVPWAHAAPTRATAPSRARTSCVRIYEQRAGPQPDDDSVVIAYCRIGERSSHTWFVLKYLLGYENVRNYDGSWTEWGNLVGVPIER
jgi:thiosulfate/3-mercaptopyruvate sulfurtransferase